MSRDLPQKGPRRGLRGPGRKNSERMYRKELTAKR